MNIEMCPYRQRWQRFLYRDFTIEKKDDEIVLTFFFEIPGLAVFTPTTRIRTDNLTLCNPIDDERARTLVFSLGMTECVSYFKAVCPRVLEVRCGALDAEDRAFWQKLYLGGLGEFLYRNELETDDGSFIEIEAPEPTGTRPQAVFHRSGEVLVPIGGGKDSAVTATLLGRQGIRARYFTVNDQPARTATVRAAGGSERDILRTYRTIDPALLELNRKGFLNGHTPFSAIVAFLGAYCAYITGADAIVLSNESSANESNVAGTAVNHQYSKSYEFERDFSRYIEKKSGADIRYFSLLRPFNELQIARFFSSLPAFHPVFRSCNAGSKQNVWCCDCAKCLFVYCILSPFLQKDRLDAIFGGCLTDREDLLPAFRGLSGLDPVKPFECVGTVNELQTALRMTIEAYRADGVPLPRLLRYFEEKDGARAPDRSLLRAFNEENAVPARFIPCVKEMFAYVSNP